MNQKFTCKLNRLRAVFQAMVKQSGLYAKFGSAHRDFNPPKAAATDRGLYVSTMA
jgi:hypothetical protein